MSCRVLGDVGKKYGSSLVLCHIQAQQNGLYNLNVANTGLGEAVLFRKGKGIPLTTPHQPAMNMDERRKLVGRKGFLSQVSCKKVTRSDFMLSHRRMIV